MKRPDLGEVGAIACYFGLLAGVVCGIFIGRAAVLISVPMVALGAVVWVFGDRNKHH